MNIKDRTAQCISRIFEPVEKSLKLHCILHKPTSTLQIAIPRLRLEFCLEPRSFSIQSRQYPGMEVDGEQSINSLVGLHNKILLVHSSSGDRVLLIPRGSPTTQMIGGHVEVRIAWQPETDVHAYSIDESLGRLVDNGNLESKLFLCHLHALTSFCLPDPLTGKTGTEQALSILRSASVQSFDQIGIENRELLADIATLSPQRVYYPPYCREMQSVLWAHELGVLSQHDTFQVEVNTILEKAHRMRIFYPDARSDLPPLPDRKDDLTKRARIRSSSFRVSGFGAEDYTQKYDALYPGCGSDSFNPSRDHVISICKILYDGIPRTSGLKLEGLLGQLWKFLSQVDHIQGPDAQIGVKSIRYDGQLMLQPHRLIAENWCRLHRLICSPKKRPNKFQLMMWLSTVAFSGDVANDILQTMASLWVVPEMKSIFPPSRSVFRPSKGCDMGKGDFRHEIRLKDISDTPEEKLRAYKGESKQMFLKRRKTAMEQNRQPALHSFLLGIQSQWPTREPHLPERHEKPEFSDYILVSDSMRALCSAFATHWDNRELRYYLSQIVSQLESQVAQPLSIPSVPSPPKAKSLPRLQRFIHLDDLLQRACDLGPPKPSFPNVLHAVWLNEMPALQMTALVDSLELQAKSTHERWYVQQLRGSVTSLQKLKETTRIGVQNYVLQKTLSDYLFLCQEFVQSSSKDIISQATPGTGQLCRPLDMIKSKVFDILAGMKHWPRLSPTLFLEQLSHHRWHTLSYDWKKAFVSYGCAITALQQAQRLASLVKNHDELCRELRNPGHTTWDPFDCPESLLLEIESGILIREAQDQIAKQMRSSDSTENTVMQLNMGEGKSSVIVPIVAAHLANGSCLVRVFVAKPQSRQMFHMLVSKLGGLLGRRVYHMPISRFLKISEAGAEELRKMCQKCMCEGGVLLVQPEHVLSLKLMCLENFIAGNTSIAMVLLETLRFFHTCSRDIVDESDENFNVKFELIYTMGLQRPVELGPQRWCLIHQLLELVQTFAPEVQNRFPQSIQVDRQPNGAVPRIRLLGRDAERELFRLVAKHICRKGIEALPICRQSKPVRDAVFAYITKPDPSTDEIAVVENDCLTGFWTETTKGPLLLLRGLLAQGILAFCLGQKRWRVNYGPHRKRRPPTRLCVPYKAKDSPSPRSEFSHPDVVIVLTSLNYYYAGLSDNDLFLAFDYLVKSDQADTEYALWANDAPGLEESYRQLVGVNLEDRLHCVDHIFPALRFRKVVVDYFLSQIVFPKEMKDFPEKLSASGWDLGEIKTQRTTGFSGTNDSRVTLPLSVKQLDLPEQNHTNALVLEYLLQPENSVTFIPVQNDESKSDAQLLLETVAKLDPQVQVILDVGAQILELTNQQLATQWLNMLPKNGPIQAIIFVNDSDEICVLDRSGRVEPLQTSPFVRQTEACFVFLDEAHTRGIDLKLPLNYRAAVTLGPAITKDKLVQGQS